MPAIKTPPRIRSEIEETSVMTTLLPPRDALAESQRLIATIEERRGDLPLADRLLAIHRPTHRALESSYDRSEQAVAAWRAALAQRWECEVAGRRIYKRILRQIVERHGGEDAPEVQLLSRGGAEADSSPAELLADLRRLHAALAVGAGGPAAGEQLVEIERVCGALESAIADVRLCETQRRVAVLDTRLASEAYRRARAETRRLLAEHYGEQMASVLGDLLE